MSRITSSLRFSPPGGNTVTPTSGVGWWQDACLSPETADNSGNKVTTPTSQIPTANPIITREQASGTFLALRLKTPAAATSPTAALRACVFGRADQNEAWQRLKTRSGADQVVISIDTAADAINGAWRYSVLDPNAHVVDCMGCNEFLVGTDVAVAATGLDSDSTVEAKIF